MHFTTPTATLVAAFTSFVGVVNPVTFTGSTYAGRVGQTMAIAWKGNTSAVTDNLKSGEPANLQTKDTIAG